MNSTTESLDGSNRKKSGWVRPHPKAVIYWIWGGFLTLLLLYGFQVEAIASWRGSTDLHTGMEAVATVMAAMVGVMALTRYYSRKDGVFLFIGVGFIGTASLDGFHALVTSAYFATLMPSAPADLAPWSWIASRLYLSVFMLLSWFGYHRIDEAGEPARFPEKIVYIGSLAFTLLCFLTFIYIPLPAAYHADIFFHRPQEFLPAALFFIALVAFLRKGDWKIYFFEHWLVMSLIFAFISHVVFMSHSSELFDYGFDIAHLLKKIGYLCVYTGLLASIYVTYRVEQETNLETLRITNDILEAELKVRKHTELRLKVREQELLRSNQELEQFAYIASHDLQEPLRKIQSFGDRLAQKYAADLDARALDYLQRMQNAAGRMSSLINDLLAYSRIRTSGENFMQVNLQEVFDGVVDDLELAVKEANCRIDCSDLPAIEADGTLMRQLFQNLLSNAIKFRDRDRPLDVTVSHEMTRPSGSPENYCEITVADNGIGFDQASAQRVFEVFGRLHARSEYPGTGIGLAVVRKIAERHGGSVDVVSVPGEGSRFCVALKTEQNTDRGE